MWKVGENHRFQFLIGTNLDLKYAFVLIEDFLAVMDRLRYYIRESVRLKLQHHSFFLYIVIWDCHANNIIESCREINARIRYERNIGYGELHDTVKCPVGDSVTIWCLLQSEQEPSIVILLDVIWMDYHVGLFAVICAVKKIQRLMVDGTVN